MRRPILIATLLASLMASGHAKADSANVQNETAHLSEWVGDYPHRKSDGKYILDDTWLKGRLEAVMGQQDFDAIHQSRAVESPVSTQDGWMRISYCQPHLCNMDSTTIYVELLQHTIMVCHHAVSFNTATRSMMKSDLLYSSELKSVDGGAIATCDKLDGEDDFGLLKRMQKAVENRK